METYDPRIDSYIESSAEFARPILNHLRKLIHEAGPEIKETVKWGFPHFDYKGTVCSMASFKEHCAFGFWKSALLSDPNGILQRESPEGMGQLGRIRSIANLPDDAVMISYIKEAISLNERGIKVAKSKSASPLVETPNYFAAALASRPEAKQSFEKLSNSHRKEYISWFEEAKTEATRNKRIEKALEWIMEGKSRHWKYERNP